MKNLTTQNIPIPFFKVLGEHKWNQSYKRVYLTLDITHFI